MMKAVPKTLLPFVDGTLSTALEKIAQNRKFVIVACRSRDMPIVYASREFLELTGYAEDEVVGKNCRFLQGPGTSRKAVQELRNSVQEERGCHVCLKNFTKAKDPFFNFLNLCPIFDDCGVAYFVGIQEDVTEHIYESYGCRSPDDALHDTRIYQLCQFVIVCLGECVVCTDNFEAPEELLHDVNESAKAISSILLNWHKEKVSSSTCCLTDYRPISSADLPSSLLHVLYKISGSFILIDLDKCCHPIVHASEGFIRLTKRPRDSIIGSSPAFLNGPLTDLNKIKLIKEATSKEKSLLLVLMNYKHDTTPFWNLVHFAPIRNAEGHVVFYISVQTDITNFIQHKDEVEVDKEIHHANLLDNVDLEDSNDMYYTLGNMLVPRADFAIIQELNEVRLNQLRNIAKVRVACRSLSPVAGLRRKELDQKEPHYHSFSDDPGSLLGCTNGISSCAYGQPCHLAVDVKAPVMAGSDFVSVSPRVASGTKGVM